ncbi:MFS-type transporter SLC18B1-like [Dermacentor silvarum]|uniref:MFS-type transporter SLC18B1-like n=1 Tax=Dermacentor silvarum TaxID=543639 RepID=UPI0018980501|nr:MFS-type transporter SLC18B1-like [Dermacentor silvarum]
MLEVAEISRQTSPLRNGDGYINSAFIIDPSDAGKKGSAGDNQQKHASVPTSSLLSVIRQSRWMLPLIYTHIWMSAAFSIMQPFFPPLAAAAGLEAWKYGFFFSATKVAMLLGSVLNQRLMAITSPRKCYLSGQIGFLLFTVLLGLMYWSPGGNVFLGLCLVLAIVGGFFSTVYLVSAYAVVTAEFPVHTGLIISTMEFMWGTGCMIGSGIGGVLIDAWAYPLPFFVLAALVSFSLPWTARSQKIPDKPLKEVQQHSSSDSRKNQENLFKLLIDPVFIIDMVTVTLSWIIMGFNEPTLEPHLRQFGLGTTELGVVFMVQFASYTIAAFVLGILCQLKMDAFCAFVGQLVTVFAYLILGPAPFIPTEAAMWMVYLSQVFTGAGMAGQFICGYCHSLKHAVARGYSDDIKTTSFISTIAITSLVFGATVAPPIAGYLVERFGYETGSMFLFGLLVIWTPVTFIQWLASSCSNKRKNQSKITTDSQISAC